MCATSTAKELRRRLPRYFRDRSRSCSETGARPKVTSQWRLICLRAIGDTAELGPVAAHPEPSTGVPDYFLKNGVPSYIRSLYDKCGVQNGVEAVSLAWTIGLLAQRPGPGERAPPHAARRRSAVWGRRSTVSAPPLGSVDR